MPQVIVLPTLVDQGNVKKGIRPDNHFLHEFATEAEVEFFVQGVEAMADLVEYQVREDRGLSIDIEIGGETFSLSFGTEAEKSAYFAGLEDGDGFFAAECVREGDDEFDATLALVSDPSPGFR